VRSLIEVEGASYAYPDGHRALSDVSLRVDRSERVALVGPNGAGKSTLVLHLNGILQPHEGRVSICGLPTVRENLREIRRTVGVVFQDPDDQLFMPSVGEDVSFGPRNLGCDEAEATARVRSALAAVGMTGSEDRPPHHLSFGQRRRVAIATVLSMEPDVLVLDEPSSNLDPAGRRAIGDILKALDLTLLIVTHDLLYALELCDRTVVMDRGMVVADGPTRRILGDEELMSRHGLELPYGADLGAVAPRPT
jgi:cobalt/nickel transport system ATP-binding protein